MTGSGKDMQPREMGHLWEGRVPIGRMTIICGAPNMGKSTLGYLIAAECDVPTLYVTLEEDAEEVWLPRLLAVGADPEKSFYHPEVRFSANPLDLAHLNALIEEHNIKLIVVDPIQAHLDTSLAHDQAVRRIMEPYMGLVRKHKIALVLECHLLTAIKSHSDPQTAVPSGLRTWTKSGYILAKDPNNSDFRILATAKWNMADHPPASLKFEFDSASVNVIRHTGGGRKNVEYGYLINRGETTVSATTLLISLTKETSERKNARAARELITFLRKGKDGRSQPVDACRAMIALLDPPMSWKTAKRAAADNLDMEILDDPQDARKKWWRLPDWIMDVVEELTEPEDEISIEEIEIPDAPPAEWGDGEDS